DDPPHRPSPLPPRRARRRRRRRPRPRPGGTRRGRPGGGRRPGRAPADRLLGRDDPGRGRPANPRRRRLVHRGLPTELRRPGARPDLPGPRPRAVGGRRRAERPLHVYPGSLRCQRRLHRHVPARGRHRGERGRPDVVRHHHGARYRARRGECRHLRRGAGIRLAGDRDPRRRDLGVRRPAGGDARGRHPDPV
ncbi:MAG: hypothetical protein AVDCRST_MAG19-936, partial [uncultured Thermomicrobiales bacterium]